MEFEMMNEVQKPSGSDIDSYQITSKFRVLKLSIQEMKLNLAETEMFAARCYIPEVISLSTYWHKKTNSG
jgi:hypothetical protein